LNPSSALLEYLTPEDRTGSDLPSVVYHKNRDGEARAMLSEASGVMRKLDFKLKTAIRCHLAGRDDAMTPNVENAFDFSVQNR
jgi:hypothetical protein